MAYPRVFIRRPGDSALGAAAQWTIKGMDWRPQDTGSAILAVQGGVQSQFGYFLFV